MTSLSIGRATRADIDLDAIAANVAALVGCTKPARFCAVVKADGYGHGAVAVSRAAVAAGAHWLAVALVEEAVVLREAGIDVPILVLSEPPRSMFSAVIEHALRVTVYSPELIQALGQAASLAGVDIAVHLKVDTGMHRVGAPPSNLLSLGRQIAATPRLRHEGTCTHLAVADAVADPYTATQLDRFEQCLAELRAEGIDPGITHAANSAGAIFHPSARFDLVRCGIAMYGLRPDDRCDPAAYGVTLRPVLSLHSAVTHVQRLAAGERPSYGRITPLARDSVVATVPIGYADGVPRRLSSVGGNVLLRGQRRAVIGRVTMDQLMVDCSTDDTIERDDEVVLLGRQGSHEISAWEWAVALDTIAYEITCGVSVRVPRRFLSSSAPGTREV